MSTKMKKVNSRSVRSDHQSVKPNKPIKNETVDEALARKQAENARLASKPVQPTKETATFKALTENTSQD